MIQKYKNGIKVTLFATLFLSNCLANTGEFKIKESSVFVPSKIGKVSLSRDNDGFYVTKDGERHKLKNYDVDAKLRSLSHDKLNKFLKNGGYLSVNQMSNNDYSLKANVRGNGGFLLTGVIVHQTCRIVGHVSVWTAAGTMVVGGAITGGPAGASAAYLAALTMVGPASAAVETGSLVIGTAASFIPGLP